MIDEEVCRRVGDSAWDAMLLRVILDGPWRARILLYSNRFRGGLLCYCTRIPD